MDILKPDDDLAAVLLGRPIELKMLDVPMDLGLIEGYASTFFGVDDHGDTIAPGAFTDTIAQHSKAGTAPAMLWHHRGSEPIGRWNSMGEDDRGLRVRGQLNLDTQRGKEAHAHLKAGDVGGLSIGYRVAPGGQARGENGTRLLKKVILHEVSVTPTPADAGARVLSVKSLASRAELENLLRETGLPRGAAKKLAAGGWPALSGEEDDEIDAAAMMKTIDNALLQLKTLKGLRR